MVIINAFSIFPKTSQPVFVLDELPALPAVVLAIDRNPEVRRVLDYRKLDLEVEAGQLIYQPPLTLMVWPVM